MDVSVMARCERIVHAISYSVDWPTVHAPRNSANTASMNFERFDPQRFFREAWESVRIARPVRFSLFTFGESVLPYFLVCGESAAESPVFVTKGDVRIKRPTIITPDRMRPELQGFFEDAEEEGAVSLLLARMAHFSNLRLANRQGEKRSVDDCMEATVERLNRRLDQSEEEHVAILTAPPSLAGMAVLRYAAERVMQSGPDNIQELRERGFLP